MRLRELKERRITDPPRPSFLTSSQTEVANLTSPSIVANSASLRCCAGGPALVIDEIELCEPVCACDGAVGGIGAAAFVTDPEPNRRRVDVKNLVGRRRDEVY